MDLPAASRLFRAAQRHLQLEARSHIAVQAWIDAGKLAGRASTAAAVGRHHAVSPGAVERFMERFESVYAHLGKMETIFAAAAAHHRLLWIHPFVAGNGRVARLVSYAMLRDSIDASGIWSVARGLARREVEYKNRLEDCDQPRRSDLDGRGTLGEGALTDFIEFFLDVCLDQVTFMERLVQPATLTARVIRRAEEKMAAGRRAARSDRLLEALLLRGELDRGDVERLLSVSERTARRTTSSLLEAGAFMADSPRAPLRLGFPVKAAHRGLPGLFPDPPSGSR